MLQAGLPLSTASHRHMVSAMCKADNVKVGFVGFLVLGLGGQKGGRGGGVAT